MATHAKKKREHFIPCFYSAGFALPPTRNGRLWCWRKGKTAPYATTPEKWGVRHGFYGNRTDESITRTEKSVLETLIKLRKNPEAQENVGDLPRLIAHLVSRTESHRESLHDLATTIEKVGREDTDRRALADELKQLQHRLAKYDKGYRDVIQDGLRRKGFRGNVLKAQTSKQFRILQEKAQHLNIEQFRDIGSTERVSIAEQWSTERHREQVSQYGKQWVWRKRYTTDLSYMTVVTEGPWWVLPDSICVEKRSGDDIPYNAGSIPLPDLECVLLPITSTILIAGYKDGVDVPTVEWTQLALVATAYESFVCSNNFPALTQLQKFIGVERTRTSEEYARQIWGSTAQALRDRKKR